MKESATNSIDLVKTIIEKNGSRISGTLGNQNTVLDLENDMKKICTTTKKETFSIHPNSLFLIGPIFASIYCIGLISSVRNTDLTKILGFGVMVIGLIFCFSQFIFYSSIFDGLFPKVKGENLIGIVEPKKTVTNQIIIIGHHDSSYIYPFHEQFPEAFAFRLFIPIILYVFETVVLGLSLLINFYIPISMNMAFIIGLLFVLPMFGYISRKPSLGAGDNLIGCTIGLSIAEKFGPTTKLDNTRIVLLLADGEEVGQKGSRHFVNSNLNLLKAIKTEVINIDTIYDLRDIILLSRDVNGFYKLSRTMNEKLHSIAKQKGYNWKISPMPFGGGGTDGGQFAKAHIETASIIGTPIRLIRKNIIHHTKNDIPECIQVDAVDSVIETITEYIMGKDKESTTTTKGGGLICRGL